MNSSIVKNVEFSKLNTDYAKLAQKKSHTDGSCLYLLFTGKQTKQPDFFFRNGTITPRLSSSFTQNIFMHDPHIMKASLLTSDSLKISNHHHYKEFFNQHASKSLRRYWHFLLTSGIKETATYIQAITPNILLVTGLVSSKDNDRIKLEDTIPILQEWTEESRKFLIEYALHKAFFPAELSTQLLPQLSKREQQVMHLLHQGYSNKEIAHSLSLSVYTIENYLRKMYQKFEVHNRTALCTKVLHQ